MNRLNGNTSSAGFGNTLLVWTVLVVVLNVARWGGGFVSGDLTGAIEEGVARVEAGSQGEVGDELIRKSIRTQRQTLSFWVAIRALDDFLLEPVILGARAVVMASAFSALAALGGRTVQFDRALADSARAQGFWVMGLAVRLAVLIILRRAESAVETSLAICLPPGNHHAFLWLFLRQIDVFTILGWFVLGRQAWNRGDVGMVGAASLCTAAATVEAVIRAIVGLAVGSAIRLSLLSSR